MSSNYKITPLLNACQKITVGHVGTTSKFYAEKGIIFIRTQNVTNSGLDLKNVRFITDEFHQSIQKSRVVAGDLLLSRVVTDEMKSVIIPPDIGEANCANVILIRPSKDLIAEYLRYLIYSPDAQKYLLGKRVGSAQQVVNTKVLREWNCKLPPIPEQQRIVAILDQAFADIEKARANAEKNLKNARELFDSYLQQVFSQRGEGWEKFNLGDITQVSSGGTPTKSTKEYWNGSIPWYSSGELNKLFTKPSKEMITDKGLRESNAKLFATGSLLIGMYDTAALKMSLLDREGCFNQAIAGVKPNDKVNLLFIYHTINFLKPELLLLRRGVRQKNLNQSKIKSIPIGLPSIEEQNEVVLLLQSLKDQSDNLVDIYTKKLESLDELKKSLLQKAFSGELTKDKGLAA